MGNDQAKVRHRIAQSRGINVDDIPEKLVLLSKDSNFDKKTKYQFAQSKKVGVILQSRRQVQRQYEYVDFLPLMDSNRANTFKSISELNSQKYKRLLLKSHDEVNHRGDFLTFGAGGASGTVIGSATGPAMGMAAVNAAGFTPAGVAAGSAAAAVQGSSVTAGSTFALCQSAGATGVFAAGTVAGCVVGGAVLLGGVGLGVTKMTLEIIYHMKREEVKKYLERYDPQYQIVLKQLRNTVRSQARKKNLPK